MQTTRFFVAGEGEGGEDVLEAQVDIFSPNAFGGVLAASSVKRLRCRIVCGAANNQLLDPADDGGIPVGSTKVSHSEFRDVISKIIRKKKSWKQFPQRMRLCP